jgi:hypothetical protein
MQVGDLVRSKTHPEKIGVVMELYVETTGQNWAERTETTGQNWAERTYRMCKVHWNNQLTRHLLQKNVEVIDG